MTHQPKTAQVAVFYYQPPVCYHYQRLTTGLFNMKNKLLLHNSSAIPSAATKSMFVGRPNGEDMYQDYYVIEGTSHMIRDSVMNELLYSGEAFDGLATELMRTNARIPAPMSHPTDMDGNFASANDPLMLGHSIGAFDTDWRVANGRLLSNTYIPVDAVNNPKPQFKDVAELIRNRKPVDRSTGLYVSLVDKQGIGTDGEPYSAVVDAIINLDHSAILDPMIEPGAKNNREGVGMYCNSKGEKAEVEQVILANSSAPAMRLPLAPAGHAWDTDAAIARVREYTGSTEKPSANYRKFFMAYDQTDSENFGAYHLPFVDIIDGTPHAVKSAIDNAKARLNQTDISDDDKAAAENVIEIYQKRFAETGANSVIRGAAKFLLNLFKPSSGEMVNNEMSFSAIREAIFMKLNEGRDDDDQAWPMDTYSTYFVYQTDSGKLYQQSYLAKDGKVEFTGEPFEVEVDQVRETTYKPVSGENAMKDKILSALNAAGIETNGLDDDALLAAYNQIQQGGKNVETADIESKIADAVANAIKPLQDQLKANADAELNKLAADVAALNKGIDETAAKAMGIEACKNFLAANGQVAFNSAGGRYVANGSDDGYGTGMPE